ncbi:DUF916 domain-containing protein [Patescibacteria group bacterium]|nr:DUF916 domain-containing protein [Patescibacteria group bacterium]
MKKIFFASILAVLVFSLAPLAASAITISPPVIEFDARPGDTIVDVLKLYNETAETQTLTGSVQTFKALNETGAPSFLSPEEATDLATWLKLDETAVTLASDERKDILFSINVPKDAEPGGHFAGVLWTPSANSTLEGSGVGITVKTGTLVLVRVAGDVNETGRLASFTADRASYNYLPVNFSVRFENLGNVHLKPVGVVEIKNLLGRKVTTLPINGDLANVLPESIRKFDATWQKTEVTLGASEWQRERENFAWGKYTATLLLDYGVDGQETSASLVFWVFPWRVTLFYLAIALIIILLIIFAIKSYNKWLIKKFGQQNKQQNNQQENPENDQKIEQ